MLYDKRWDAKVETTIRHPSIEGLVAWLETKDPAGRYPWSDCLGGCLIDQYLVAHGMQPGGHMPYFAAQDAIDANGKIQANLIAIGLPRTFGAALERARAVMTTKQR